VYALRDSGVAPDLPWYLLRRGSPELGEPDFVFGAQDAQIEAGIEITELDNNHVRKRNAKLRELQTGRYSHRGRKRSNEIVEVMNDVNRAFREAGGAGSEFQRLQRFVPKYTGEQIQRAIRDRIADKRTKCYYVNALYPIHLIVYLRDYIICKDAVQQAIQPVTAHDAGRFAGIWCVHHDRSVANLKA
jgi:hypothetical protein